MGTESAGPVLATARLELTPVGPQDRHALHVLFALPEVRRYLLDDQVMPLTWVDEEIERSQGRFLRGEGGLWTIRLRPESDPGIDGLIGFVGYRDFFDPPDRQLLYGLSPVAWGRGYATEAAAAAVEWAFESGITEKVVAATDPPNVASERVMQRLGMVRMPTPSHWPKGTLRYEVVRLDWTDPGEPPR